MEGDAMSGSGLEAGGAEMEMQPQPGEFWELARAGVSETVLVVDTGPGCLLVWPVSAVTRESCTLWPSIALAVDRRLARRRVTTLLSVGDCQELRRHHRDTMALKAVQSEDGRAVFFAASPWTDDRHRLLRVMQYLEGEG